MAVAWWQLCDQGELMRSGKWNQQKGKNERICSFWPKNMWCWEESITDVLAEGPGGPLPTTQGCHQRWVRSSVAFSVPTRTENPPFPTLNPKKCRCKVQHTKSGSAPLQLPFGYLPPSQVSLPLGYQCRPRTLW